MLAVATPRQQLHPPTPGPTQSHTNTDTDPPSPTPTHDHPHLNNHSIPEQIGRECEKAAKGIFPLSVVLIRKVKVLKKPKFDRKCPTPLCDVSCRAVPCCTWRRPL